MAFSIPQTIYPAYTIPEPGPVNVRLNVGASIKDLPPNAETTMKKANDMAIAKTIRQFEADSTQFDKDLKAAEIKAESAKKIISKTRNKKALSITSLAANIIAIVAVGVIAVATWTWPILFAAVPFAIGSVPSSYYTHVFCKKVNELENDIAAPGKMKRPVLTLPVYNPKKDMDLLQSRIDTQNTLASMSIRQIFDADVSNDEIIGYELLNRATHISPEKRPAFYAKCIQLINAYGQIDKEYKQYNDKAQREYDKLDREFRNWKSQQESYLRSQEWALQERERRVNRTCRENEESLTVQIIDGVGTMFSRWELEKMKTQFIEGSVRRDMQNREWYKTTVQAIKNAYQQASVNIENQYAVAKAAAV